MTSERARLALALRSAGHSYEEIAAELGYKSADSVRVMVHYARHILDGRDQSRVSISMRSDTHRELMAVAKEWKCSLNEVIRTFIVCGLEDLKNEGED